MTAIAHPGVLAALTAAALFGLSVPLAKQLLGGIGPWMLAGLLYFGSGIGLLAFRLARNADRVLLARAEAGWLAGAILAGGMVGPVLLMWGLARMPASGASLLLNAEGVATALMAWFVFRESVDRRIALGMALIVGGALLLSWPGESDFGDLLPALSILGACLAWALDNNLTRKVAMADAGFIAMLKGLAAGSTNLCLALLAGATLPHAGIVLTAGLLGFVCYGLSLVLFVIGLRHIGTARTGAYFSIAPFVGAFASVLLLGEPLTPRLLGAGVLMALGVWLHVTERHAHAHTHEAQEHAHAHTHDAHHRHEHDAHDGPVAPGTRHAHVHRHEPLTHSHPHFPDADHRHDH